MLFRSAVRRPLVGPGMATAWIEPGRRVGYWFEALQGVLGRLSSAPVVDLAPFRREADRLGDLDMDADPRWVRLKASVAAAVARALPPPHNPDLAEALLGVSVRIDASESLHEALHAGTGDAAGLVVSVANDGPSAVRVRVGVEIGRAHV